jgi:hypothetical protein
MAESKSQMKADNYVKQAIVQLLVLKLRAGTSVSQLRDLIDECLQQASKRSRGVPTYRGLDIHRLGSILRSWHKEADYLTPDGLPRPLNTSGKASLRSLIRRFYPAEKSDLVFGRLVESNLIKELDSNRWVPSGRTARMSLMSHETLEHLAEGVARYVETVTNNVTAKGEEDVLFERSCKVTRLPARELKAFRDYVGQQALAFLTSVDDWLESRNAKLKKAGGRYCTAGAYTFAFINEGKRPLKSRRRSPR